MDLKPQNLALGSYSVSEPLLYLMNMGNSIPYVLDGIHVEEFPPGDETEALRGSILYGSIRWHQGCSEYWQKSKADLLPDDLFAILDIQDFHVAMIESQWLTHFSSYFWVFYHGIHKRSTRILVHSLQQFLRQKERLGVTKY